MVPLIMTIVTAASQVETVKSVIVVKKAVKKITQKTKIAEKRNKYEDPY